MIVFFTPLGARVCSFGSIVKSISTGLLFARGPLLSLPVIVFLFLGEEKVKAATTVWEVVSWSLVRGERGVAALWIKAAGLGSLLFCYDFE